MTIETFLWLCVPLAMLLGGFIWMWINPEEEE